MMLRTGIANLCIDSTRSIVMSAVVLFICGCDSTDASRDSVVNSAIEKFETPATQTVPDGDSFGVVVEPKLASLGSIKVSTKGIETTFTISNSSASKVRIVELKSSCGCTVAQPASLVIAPHGKTTVRTTVVPKSAGPKDASVRVFLVRLDDNRTDTLQLRLHWDAAAPISIRPDRIDAGELLDSDKWTGSFSIETFDGSPVTSFVKTIAASPPEDISIHTSLPDDDRGTLSIDFSITANATAIREHKGFVTLKCSDEIGALHVPVVWKRSPSVYLEPAGTYKGKIASGADWQSTLTLTSTQLEISGVETSPTFNAGFEAAQLNKSAWRIMVKGIVPTVVGPFSLEIPVRVTFSDNSERSLVYSVTGVVL